MALGVQMKYEPIHQVFNSFANIKWPRVGTLCTLSCIYIHYPFHVLLGQQTWVLHKASHWQRRGKVCRRRYWQTYKRMSVVIVIAQQMGALMHFMPQHRVHVSSMHLFQPFLASHFAKQFATLQVFRTVLEISISSRRTTLRGHLGKRVACVWS